MYSDQVKEHFANPRNCGQLADAHGEGCAGEPGRGNYMIIQARLDDGRVAALGYKTYGCPPAIAAGSCITEMALGRSVEEALTITREELLTALGGLPLGREHCAALAVDALTKAVQAAADAAPSPDADRAEAELTDCFGLGVTEDEILRWDELWISQLAGEGRPSDWGPHIFAPSQREGPVLERFRRENLPGIPPERLDGARFMEIGCGIGRLVRLQLGSAPSRYVGLDVSRFAIALARGRFHGWDGREFYHVVDDRDRLLAMRDEFDVVFGVSVFIHTPPERAAKMLDYMAQAAAPGGWVSVDCFVGGRPPTPAEWRPGQRWDVFADQVDEMCAAMQARGLVGVQFHHTLEKRGYVVGQKPERG